MAKACAWSRLLLALCSGVCTLQAVQREASADTAKVRVVFVFESSNDALLSRIETEVVAVGFEVVERTDDLPLEELARAEQAEAAVRVLPNGTGVEVWMADATSGRSLLRQVIVDERPGGPDHALIALQTSELLRTSLLSHSEGAAVIKAPAAKPGPQAPSVEPSEPKASISTKGVVVELGPGVLYSPGGVGPALQLWVTVQQSLSEHWGLGLELSAPLKRGELSDAEGTAALGVYSVGFGGSLHTAPTSRYFAAGGVGVALARLVFEGEAQAPLRASSPGVWTGAASVHAEAGVQPANWLRLGLAGVGGLMFERVNVQFVGRPAGEWGHVFVGAYAFVGVPFR